MPGRTILKGHDRPAFDSTATVRFVKGTCTTRSKLSPTIQYRGIDRLSVGDRLRLLEEIWDTLSDSAQELPIPDWHKAELDRRLAQAEAQPEGGRSWDEVKDRLWKKE